MAEKNPGTEKTADSVQQACIVITAYAPLKVAAAGNYLRYGPTGVQRFGPGSPAQPIPHPHQIKAHLTLKNARGEVLLDFSEVLLRDNDPDEPFDLERTNIWVGGVASASLRITWIWDFYRMFSGTRLEVNIPKDKVSDDWQSAYDIIRNLAPGDQIILSVTSKSGDILQVYPVDEPPQKIE